MNDIEQLIQLIKNLDVSHQNFIESIVRRMAIAKSEKFGGVVVFKAEMNQGGVADAYFDMGGRLIRKRKARSKGL